jgi:hypothetical protein
MAGTEGVASFIKGSAEASRRLDLSKAAHGGIALFDATVILLDAVVERAVASVNRLVTECLADGTGRGIMPIGRDLLWCMTYDVDSLLEKALGRLPIPLLGSARNQPDSHRDRWPDTDRTISL